MLSMLQGTPDRILVGCSVSAEYKARILHVDVCHESPSTYKNRSVTPHMVDSRLNRRRFIAVAGVVGIAGCSDADAPAADGGDDASDTGSGTDGADSTAADEEASDTDGRVLYVAPDGDDDSPGTEDQPFARIHTAVQHADPRDTVSVASGEYIDRIHIRDGGEPDAPITITGPTDAVVKPPERELSPLNIKASHVHLRGLSFDGLIDPDNPDDPNSYAELLISVSPPWDEDADGHDEYVEDIVVKPDELRHSAFNMIRVARTKNAELGEFKVTGLAGANWILPDRANHRGEIIYLGSPPIAPAIPDEFPGYPWNEYDQTRNIHIHHIDNSDAHPHSQLVDSKTGTRNVLIEYCTDAGGSQQGYEADRAAAIRFNGSNITLRWNRIENVRGDAVMITRRLIPDLTMDDLEGVDPGSDQAPDLDTPRIKWGQPETELERQMAKQNSVYGNVFAGYTHNALRFEHIEEDYQQGLEDRGITDPDLVTPADQERLCGNEIDGDTHASPTDPCDGDVPQTDDIGHLGGDSPWS